MKESPLQLVRLQDKPPAEREKLLERSESDMGEIFPKVEDIISRVKNRGDEALIDFTSKFDGIDLSSNQIKVSDEEIELARESLDNEYADAIKEAAKAIERYHKTQLPKEWSVEFEPGIEAGQVVRPLSSVGSYTPGGTAQYPSSLLMSVIPAKVAGVEKVIVCTPPNSENTVNPATLVAADIAGADEVYKVGGAQSIGAMAYGTNTIPAVNKIVGPGNVYVSAAKEIVSTEVDIDFLAGPSEVLIIADSSADPRMIALDLTAQAEHDPNSSAVLVTTSEKLAEKVIGEVEEILEEIPREDIARESLQRFGRVIIAPNTKDTIKFANDYAPEHLQIMTENPESVLDEIKNAGAIFLGHYTPTSVGDFAVGPSHILPTGGSSKRYDGISVYDFIRMPSVQKVSREGLKNISEVVRKMSEMEDLSVHAQSVLERLGE